MLTKEMNQRLTQVGPGTPGGEMLRRYWHPIATSVELEENPVKKVRVMCEDLVLYRDKSGNLGLIDEPCPHRRVSLEYGIPENEGLRCPYHGWLFNHEGRCLEQPAEPWNSTFKERIRTKAYKVQELTGLIFAYMGPDPAPLLPRYDLFVWDNVIRQIGITMLPGNWVQCMENSLDPVHVEWLHGHFLEYSWERKGKKAPMSLGGRRHRKIGFDRFEHGLIKRRVSEGGTEEDDGWRIGHPIVFPNILRVGGNGNYCFQYRTPVDDNTTYHIRYTVYRPRIPMPPQQSIPMYEIPIKYDNGEYVTDVILPQDFFAWATQGPVAQRDKEHLGQSDVGVIMYRELVLEQMSRVEAGEEPMEVYRDPAKNICIDMVQEEPGPRNGFSDGHLDVSEAKFSPIAQDIIAAFKEAEERKGRGEPWLPARVSPRYPIGEELHRQVEILP